MEKAVIGSNAGIVWETIHKNGTCSLNKLKRTTKLDTKNLYLALGWLARENKVMLNTVNDELEISLIY